MFKFDFKVDDSETENKYNTGQLEIESDKEQKDASIEWYNSQEVQPSVDIIENLDVYKLNSAELTAGTTTLAYVISGYLLKDLSTNSEQPEDILKAEQNHSDLIPGVYEGGAKKWECTDDLLTYISENCQSLVFRGKNVLDLGCGSGILGIYAYKNGARVQFQDYNKDVLEKITIPNVILNVPKSPKETDLDLKEMRNELQFYSGDWSKYVELTTDDNKFDVILTSETIYNPKNQQKLLNAFNDKLTQTGIVLVAAKSYYFGVGGGLRQFEDLIQRDDRFSFNSVWKSTEGVGREILELKRK